MVSSLDAQASASQLLNQGVEALARSSNERDCIAWGTAARSIRSRRAQSGPYGAKDPQRTQEAVAHHEVQSRMRLAHENAAEAVVQIQAREGAPGGADGSRQAPQPVVAAIEDVTLVQVRDTWERDCAAASAARAVVVVPGADVSAVTRTRPQATPCGPEDFEDCVTADVDMDELSEGSGQFGG